MRSFQRKQPFSRYTLIALSLVSLTTFSGCATMSSSGSGAPSDISFGSAVLLPDPHPPATSPEPQDTTALGLLMKQSVLKDFFAKWRGVPYRWGGNDYRGVDCSGFTKRAYNELYDLQLPRKAIQQYKQGYKIGKNELEPGDLVFFAQKGQVDHVGIYLGDEKFLHASTSKGVTITPLNHRYWRRYFRMARRYFEPDGSAAIASVL